MGFILDETGKLYDFNLGYCQEDTTKNCHIQGDEKYEI